jgi:hypothetical protein
MNRSSSTGGVAPIVAIVLAVVAVAVVAVGAVGPPAADPSPSAQPTTG